MTFGVQQATAWKTAVGTEQLLPGCHGISCAQDYFRGRSAELDTMLFVITWRRMLMLTFNSITQ